MKVVGALGLRVSVFGVYMSGVQAYWAVEHTRR